MADTIDVPAVGSVDKKKVYIIGGLAGGVAAYAWWRARSTPPAQDDVIPPEDPYEGLTDSGAGGAVSGYSNSSPDTQQTGPLTNAEWSALAMERLIGAYEQQAITDALGGYLGRRALTSQEQRIVQAAIAVAGYPPVGTFTVIPGGDTAITVEPKGLIARGVFENSFSLMWNAVAGAAKYSVYEGATKATTTANTQWYSTGRKAATKYGPFTVKAVASNGTEGPASAPIFVTTSGTPPIRGSKPVTAPQKLHATDVEATAVDIGWNAVTGARFYDVYRNGKKIFRHSGTYHSDRGLRRNTTYSYYVVAIDAEGKASKRSSTLKVKTKK